MGGASTPPIFVLCALRSERFAADWLEAGTRNGDELRCFRREYGLRGNEGFDVRFLMVLMIAAGLASNAGEAAAKSADSKSTSAKPSTQSKRAATSRAKTRVIPLRPSEGQVAGLHRSDDPLDLRSSVVLLVDQDTEEVLFAKNEHAVLPIASITKLMTALVTIDAGLDLDEELLVTLEDRTVDRMRSNLRPGLRITRARALHLALMSSENHAAHLLGRTYPGGKAAFVDAMNAKALLLGMKDTRFDDPTGLSPDNRSSAEDLVKLVKAAYEYPVIREYSTSTEASLPVGKRLVRYGNTNRLTSNPDWDIGLQKTGFISAAGRCLVMQAVIEGRRVVMVLLDSVGKYSRLGDAQRLRDWMIRNVRPVERTAQASEATTPL
jgi:D-alanyl-D-alanine endopeptidase (penicillin-binding protein 7)